MRKLALQIVFSLASCAFIQSAQAPQHVGINDTPAKLKRLVHAVARAENCPQNPGCIRRRDGSYRRYSSRAAGLRDLQREIERRRGHSVRWILESFNAGGTPGYAEFVAKLAGLRVTEVLP